MVTTFLGMQLSEVLFLLVFNAIYCNGIFYAARDGKVLSFLHYSQRILPRLLYDGLINCIQCMGSIHGTYFLLLYLAYNGVPIVGGVFSHWWDLLLIPCYTFSLSFMNLLINRTYEVIEQAKIKLI